MSQKNQVKCLAVVLVLALSGMGKAETPVVEWIRQLGTAHGDYGTGVSVDSSGNAYVTGYTAGGLDGNTNAGYSDMFLTKYDTDGSKLWTQQLGSDRYDKGYGVSVDRSGNAYVTGCTGGSLDGNTIAGSDDIFLTKYNTDGAKLWTRQLGSDNNDKGYGVSVDGSGNAHVTGWTTGDLDGNTSAGLIDMFLTKYGTADNKLWTRQLGTTSIDSGLGVSVDGNGNSYVTGWTTGGLDGNTNAGSGDGDMFLTKYDTAGTKQWTRQLGTASYDDGCGVSVDGSGNAYVTGWTGGGLDSNTSSGWEDIFLTKYDTAGTKLWSKQLGTASRDYGYGVSVDGSGNAYVTGRTHGDLDGNTSAGSDDLFLTKCDTDGIKLWTQQLGTASDDYGIDVSVDDSGNAYVAGHTYGGLDGNINAGGWDMFLVKISSVPEPGSIVMLVGVGLVGLLCRRRKCG